MTNRHLYQFAVILVLMNCLGFPGNWTRILGNSVGTLIDYGCFGLEIAVMLLSSGENILDIRIVDLRKQYLGIYAVLLVFFTESMLVSRYPNLQIITCVRFTVAVLISYRCCVWHGLCSSLQHWLFSLSVRDVPSMLSQERLRL